MHEHTVISLAVIGLLASICQWIAWRVKLPSILFLLLTGIVSGPVTGWLNPDRLFGDLLLPIVSLSVAIILFEGSLTLRLDEIRGAEKVVRRLVSTGLFVTWGVTTIVTRWLLGFSWELALLFGAVTVVTGPTVIVPMLRSVRPTAHIANILRWEGILIDPIGALLAVLAFEFIVSSEISIAFSHTLIIFGSTILVGLAVGAAVAYLFGLTLRHHAIPEYLHNVITLTLVFGVFALANVLQEESGLIAVTVMGVWLANMKGVPVRDILNFKESLSILLISGLFIILAARVDLQQVQVLGWSAVGVFLAMQFVGRPLKVMVATLGSGLSWRERTLLGWIAPRGIVAAAVAALFAIRLEQMGYQDASLLVPLTFMIIIGTVVLQSAFARPLASWLGVAEPEAKGFLIIGANPLARMIAKALNGSGFRTLLVDNNWAAIRAASMENLDTYFGSAVSSHADRNLNLVGIGFLLGLSSRQEANSLAAMRFRTEFGANAVFSLHVESNNEADSSRSEKPEIGATLFGHDVSYSSLTSMLSDGAKIRETKITEAFDYHDYYRKHFKRAVPLFAIDPRGRLRIFTADKKLEPTAGWSVLALITPEDKTEAGEEDRSGKKAGNSGSEQTVLAKD